MGVNKQAVVYAGPWRVGHGLRLREVHYRPGALQPRHSHQGASLSLVLAGSLEESAGPIHYRAAAGSLVIKPAGLPHANVYGPRGARVVQIEPERAEHGLPSAYHWQETGRLARCVLQLLQGDSAEIEPLEVAFWDALAQISPPGGTQTTKQPRWWRDALDLMHSSAGGVCSVSEIASHAGVHPVHLARVCRQLLGCSVRDYLCQRRTLMAWRACEATQQSLAVVAAQTGFADQAHMTRCFRKFLGVSPARLRRLSESAA